MATYKHRFTPATGNEPDGSLFHVVERPLGACPEALRGSSRRLGVDAQEVDLGPATPAAPTTAHPSQWRYELTDHLGNVQAVVTEELLGLDATNDQSVDQWAPVLLSAQDYEAFGSLLPARNYSSESYRFGLNGQEKDDEIYGSEGTSYTAEYWQYDPRVARRWNMDPVDKPWMSPYHAFSNKPITNNDPNGACDDCPDKANAKIGDTVAPNGIPYVLREGEAGAVWARQGGDLPELVVRPEISQNSVDVKPQVDRSKDSHDGGGWFIGGTLAGGAGYTVAFGFVGPSGEGSFGKTKPFVTYGPAFGYDASVDLVIFDINSTRPFEAEQFAGDGFSANVGGASIAGTVGADRSMGYPEENLGNNYSMKGTGVSVPPSPTGSVSVTKTIVFPFPILGLIKPNF